MFKKLILLSIVLLNISLFANPISSSGDALYFQLGGSATTYSFNYMKRVVNVNQFSLNTEVGLGLTPMPNVETHSVNNGTITLGSMLSIPLGLNIAILGKNDKASFEVGGNYSNIFLFGNGESGYTFMAGFSTGLKVTPPDKRVFFRVKCYYLKAPDTRALPFPGVSIGWQL